jgi:formylglycine-generating enzyme required for sulfatase activity
MSDDTTVYEFLIDNFTLEELDALAMEIGLDPGDIDGDLLAERARSLVHYMKQRNETALLGVALRDLRPVEFGLAYEEEVEPEDRLDAPVAKPEGYRDERTGIELVRVPAGDFLYGDPAESHSLGTFHIGRAPVTNAQYQRFLDENPEHPIPFVSEGWALVVNWDRETRRFPDGLGDHPVVLVSWEDALAFARWAGLRLPTKEAWEKAARGADARRYPWGDDAPAAGRANFGRAAGGIMSVESHSPHGDSPYGAADMAGNVWEWTASWYDLGVEDDLIGARVVRGGAWDSDEMELESAYRRGLPPEERALNVGFRVAA